MWLRSHAGHRTLTGPAWASELSFGNPSRFRQNMKMCSDTFATIKNALLRRRLIGPSQYVSVDEKIAILMFIVGHAASNRQAQERFQRSVWTVTRWIRDRQSVWITNIVAAVSTSAFPRSQRLLRRLYIYPIQQSVPARSWKIPKDIHIWKIASVRWMVPISPFNHRLEMRSRSATDNLLAACSFDLKSIYVLAGWEGSAAHSAVLTDALGKGLVIPRGKYYLGDAVYGLSDFCLTPYRGVLYHLREWALGNQRPCNAKELFNLRHAQQRNAIERIFGVIKNQFPILKTVTEYPIQTQVRQ